MPRWQAPGAYSARRRSSQLPASRAGRSTRSITITDGAVTDPVDSGRSTAQLQALHAALVAPGSKQCEERLGAFPVLRGQEAVGGRRPALLVDVARRALEQVSLVGNGETAHGGAPLFFRLDRRLDVGRRPCSAVPDDVCEMLGLLVEHVREVDCQAGLCDPEEEHVREAFCIEAVEGRGAIRPLRRETDAVAAHRVVAGTLGELRPDLDARGEDAAVEL